WLGIDFVGYWGMEKMGKGLSMGGIMRGLKEGREGKVGMSRKEGSRDRCEGRMMVGRRRMKREFLGGN
ncbi:hypothetical protein, partial [Paenibacillus xylanexedens]|uniref:hypothetical protein n=1 Tax=Paenibacillus xylanexedens TaxID=528191 RepID=UPI001C92D448